MQLVQPKKASHNNSNVPQIYKSLLIQAKEQEQKELTDQAKFLYSKLLETHKQQLLF